MLNKLTKSILFSLALNSSMIHSNEISNSPFIIPDYKTDKLYESFNSCGSVTLTPPYYLSYKMFDVDNGYRCFVPLSNCGPNGPMKIVDCDLTIKQFRKTIDYRPGGNFNGYRILGRETYYEYDYVYDKPKIQFNNLNNIVNSIMFIGVRTLNPIMSLPKHVLKIPLGLLP